MSRRTTRADATTSQIEARLARRTKRADALFLLRLEKLSNYSGDLPLREISVAGLCVLFPEEQTLCELDPFEYPSSSSSSMPTLALTRRTERAEVATS